jgi:hypothetical protein
VALSKSCDNLAVIYYQASCPTSTDNSLIILDHVFTFYSSTHLFYSKFSNRIHNGFAYAGIMTDKKRDYQRSWISHKRKILRVHSTLDSFDSDLRRMLMLIVP